MTRLRTIHLLTLLAVTLAAGAAGAQLTACCRLPDLGLGTVTMAPACPEGYIIDFVAVDGLPAGTTIEFSGFLFVLPGGVESPGGALGGTQSTFNASLQVTATGTGALAGFNRFLTVPLSGVADFAPRTPGDAVQTFAADLVSLSGPLFGDPDFCTFEFEAGTGLGLPSPGSTTLTRVGPPGTDFLVDSFFDIDYTIEFLGCPGSILEGFGGVTSGEDYIYTCEEPVGVDSAESWGSVKSLFSE